MNTANINWKEDYWFSQHHADHITEECKLAWEELYGIPDDYVDQREEYWIRCGFFWLGWKAARSCL